MIVTTSEAGPKSADKAPRKLFHDYALDKEQLHNCKLEYGVMMFTSPHKVTRPATTVLAS